MITLKTLPEATAQQVFEQVARHLLTQREPARINIFEKCSYRLNGLKCAAGCLIADDEYDVQNMENETDTSWDNLVENKVVPNAHRDLIVELQEIHDGISPEYWEVTLLTFGKNQNLDTSFLSEFSSDTPLIAN